MTTATNDITGQPIMTMVRANSKQYHDGHERIFGDKERGSNPRFYPEDEEQIEIECFTCEKVFIGGSSRTKCRLCC